MTVIHVKRLEMETMSILTLFARGMGGNGRGVQSVSIVLSFLVAAILLHADVELNFATGVDNKFDVYKSKVETAAVSNRTREDDDLGSDDFEGEKMELAYVRSAKDETYVQVLESVLVGPINVGNYRFVFEKLNCKVMKTNIESTPYVVF
nr:probable histone chaperone ASF1A [Tanacetum cinerariifolium]